MDVVYDVVEVVNETHAHQNKTKHVEETEVATVPSFRSENARGRLHYPQIPMFTW